MTIEFIAFQKDCLPIIENWFQNDETKQEFGGIPSLQDWAAWVCEARDQKCWIIQDQGKPVGLIQLEISGQNAGAFLIIIDPDQWNNGYGKKSLIALENEVDIHKIRKLHAHVNPASQKQTRFFKSAGFSQSGTDKDGYFIFTKNV